MANKPCPRCQSPLRIQGNLVQCSSCGAKFHVQRPTKKTDLKPEASPPVATEEVEDDDFFGLETESDPFATDEFEDDDFGMPAPPLPHARRADRKKPKPKSSANAPKSKKKDTKRKPKSEEPRFDERKKQLAIYAGGGVIALVGLLLIWMVFGPSGDSGNGDQDSADGNVAWATEDYVIVNQPPAGAAPKDMARRPHQFATLEEFRGEEAAEDVAPPKEAAPKSTGFWNVEPDPRPESANFTMADGLSLPAWPMIGSQSVEPFYPILADRDGPFVLMAPRWLKSPYQPDPATGEITPPKELPTLYDLRTGKPAGTFSWKSAFAKLSSRLSPDGQYLIGSDANATDSSNRPELPGIEVDYESIFVWKRNETEPHFKFQPEGAVKWAEFVSPTRLAMYVLTLPKGSIQLWDVEAKTQLWSQPIINRTVGAGRDILDPAFDFAVSPGGKYIVFADEKLIKLMDAGTGEVYGEMRDPNFRGTRELDISSDGRQLWIAEGSTLYRHSLTTGEQIDKYDNLWFKGRVVDAAVPYYLILTNWRLSNSSSGLFDYFRRQSRFEMDPLIRWSKSGPSLYFGGNPTNPLVPMRPSQNTPAFLYTSTAVFDEIEKLRETAPFDLPDRAGDVAVTHDGSAPQPPEPPKNWSPIKSVEPVVQKGKPAALTQRPAAVNSNHSAVLEYVPITRNSKSRSGTYSNKLNEIWWRTYELSTGQEVGERRLLFPWSTPREVNYGMAYPPAALSEKRSLAVCDPDYPRRVCAWSADGKLIAGFFPAGREITTPNLRRGFDPFGRLILGASEIAEIKPQISWLGWDRDERLLLLIDGVVSGWELEGKTALFQYAGDYKFAELSPGRDWIAAVSTSSIDLIETKTGKLLNRLTDLPGSMIREAVISPDGSQLATLIFSKEEQKSPAEPLPLIVRLNLWNLDTGKILSTSTYLTPEHYGMHQPRLVWLDREHLYFYTKPWKSTSPPNLLIDVRGPVVAGGFLYKRIRLENMEQLPEFLMTKGPFRRLWVRPPLTRKQKEAERQELGNTQVPWSPLELLPADDPMWAKLTAPDRKYILPQQSPVQVEVSLGEEENSRRQAEAIAVELRNRGYQIASGGSKLRLKYGTAPSTTTLESGSRKYELPMVILKWELVSPKGEPLWEFQQKELFRGRQSKFFRGHNSTHLESVENYEFPDSGVDEAVIEEILNGKLNLQGLDQIPNDLLVVGGQTSPLPLTFEVAIPPGEE